MKKLKLKQAVVVSLAMIGLLAGQAYAAQEQVENLPAQPVATFSEAEVNALFIKALFDHNADQPMQLAALSQQEMMETEGAAVLFWAAGAILVRGAAHYVPRGVISSRQATTIAKRGGNVFSNNTRAAQQVATQAFGRGNVAFHNAHNKSPIFRAHFQPAQRVGNNSHIFLRR